MGVNLGLDLAASSMPNDPAIVKAALAGLKGYLLAWDPVAKKAVWRVDHAGPASGGVLATGGNLVFHGDYAGEFAAYRADNGQKVWSSDARTAVLAAPIAYEIEGREYIAIEVGKGGSYGLTPGIVSLVSGKRANASRILVYGIGGKMTLPANESESPGPIIAPNSTADKASIAQGLALYSRFCAVCHGDTGVSGSITPDLRYTPHLADESFYDIVLGGALKNMGMASFAPVLDRTQATSIRDYLIERANQTAEGLASGRH
jgi:alcohol dehydrogenase (cytochrome c)/quinohemoprotein ethanol dehydrogenase